MFFINFPQFLPIQRSFFEKSPKRECKSRSSASRRSKVGLPMRFCVFQWSCVFLEFFSFKLVAYQPHFCQISHANLHQFEKLKRLVQSLLLGKFSTHQRFGLMLYILRFLLFFENQTYQCSQWNYLCTRCFFFWICSYQPFQHSQISCANKQQAEKLKTLMQHSLLGKI